MQARYRILAAVGLLLPTLFMLDLAHAKTSIWVVQDRLSPTSIIANSPAKATLRVHSSSCVRVQLLGVAVRDRLGNNLDFPGPVWYPQICPSGITITTASRTFQPGTYTEFGFYKDAAGYHDLAPQKLIVSQPVTSPPGAAQGKRLAWSEEFTRPIVWGSRWVGDHTSAYQYGDHNPNDDKLDWLNSSDVSVSGGVVTFTAQPSNHWLENGRQAWNTGLITTEDSQEGFRVRTGDYVETRVLMPSGYGAWPALWTWKDGDDEVDSFEYHPDNPNILELNNHVHMASDYYQNPSLVGPGRWVTIGVYYGATSVVWYVNGVKVFADGVGVGTTWSAYLILNLSVDAGLYHPAPQNSKPLTFSADYIRVWR